MDGFSIIAEPTRRRVLELLRERDREVGELVEAVGISPSLMSKHLRVLRDHGAVVVTRVGKSRVYSLASQPLSDVSEWMWPYIEQWRASFERLDRALAEEES